MCKASKAHSFKKEELTIVTEPSHYVESLGALVTHCLHNTLLSILCRYNDPHSCYLSLHGVVYWCSLLPLHGRELPLLSSLPSHPIPQHSTARHSAIRRPQ